MHIGHMAELVDSLLTLARADEGRLPLAVTDVRPPRAGRRSVRNRQHSGRRRALTVTASIPEVPVPLRVDRNRVRQMLLNLVTNAVKYTAEGGDRAGTFRPG